MGFKSLDDDTFFGTFSRVKRFRGTADERRTNRRTHTWRHRQLDENEVESYCDVCCCMDWHETANWPCNRPQREVVGLQPTEEVE